MQPALEPRKRRTINQRALDYYPQLRWIRERFVARPRYAGIPMADYGRENITGLSYHVGIVMFAALYDLAGAETFNEIIGGFYQRYADTGATTDEFVVYAKSVSEVNLGRFFHDWMYTTEWYSHVRDGATLEDLVTLYRLRGAGSVPELEPGDQRIVVRVVLAAQPAVRPLEDAVRLTPIVVVVSEQQVVGRERPAGVLAV